MNIKQLVTKWNAVLSEGREIKNSKVKKSTAVMLENQHKFLTGTLSEANSTSYGGGSMDPNSTGYAGDAMFHRIAVPMVRRTFPELIAHQIVGVQPLTGPVGLAFALRFTAGQAYDQVVGTELGHNTIDNAYTGTGLHPSGTGMGVTEGEALGSNAVADVNGHPGITGGLGIGTGEGIKEVNMTVEKAQVEAKTRKLRSRWSLEVAQDLKAMHGLDLEEEMMDILAYEITAEIDRELIWNIDSIATNSSWDYVNDADGRWEAEKYRNMYNNIIRKSNQIAIDTRRGAGNFLIAHPTVAAAIETLSSFTIAPVPTDVNTAVTGVSRLGSLDGRLTVYRDTFSTNEQAIIGFKGPSEYDTGIIYLPYIQLLVNRAVFEDSFNPTVGLMSRYAIHSHIFGASNYYQKINMINLP